MSERRKFPCAICGVAMLYPTKDGLCSAHPRPSESLSPSQPVAAERRQEVCWECDEPDNCLSAEVCYASHKGYPQSAQPVAAPTESSLTKLLEDAENELYEVKETLRRWVERANALERRVRELEQ